MIRNFTLLMSVLFFINGYTQVCNPVDFTFGTDGKAIGLTTVGSGLYPNAQNLMIQSDNKIIQVFQSNVTQNDYSFGLMRYHSNGKIDSTFGTNGKVITQIGTNNSFPRMGVLQPDGKIIVVGNALNGNNFDFAIVRYNPDGSLDNSFGISGKVLTPVGANYDFASGIALQDSGKFTVVGGSSDNMNVNAWAMVRYRANGSLDSSFGNNGKIIRHLGNFIEYIGPFYYGTYANEAANAVVSLPGGKVMVAGDSYYFDNCYDYYGGIYCNPAFAMIRLNKDGSIDSTFGVKGKVVDSIKLLYGGTIKIQDDGKIVAAGGGYSGGFIVERFNDNGSLDGSFGSGGIVEHALGGLYNYLQASSLSIGDNGKIVVSGQAYNNSAGKAMILKLDAKGKPDSTFNLVGYSSVAFGQATAVNYVTDVSIRGNRMLASGYVYESIANINTTNIGIIRLVDSLPLLVPLITTAGPASICQGESLVLRSSEKGQIQWYRNNAEIYDARDTTYTVTSGGVYAVLVSNAQGCGFSAGLGITEKASPAVPTVTYVNDPLSAYLSTVSGFARYQWYLNNAVIPGADSNKYSPVQAGSYTVRIFDGNNCSAVSAAYNYVVTSVTDIVIGSSKLSFFPNPANTVINIEMPRQSYDKLLAELYDLNGKLIQKIEISHGHNEMNVSSVPTGAYQLQIYSKKERSVRKIIVAR